MAYTKPNNGSLYVFIFCFVVVFFHVLQKNFSLFSLSLSLALGLSVQNEKKGMYPTREKSTNDTYTQHRRKKGAVACTHTYIFQASNTVPNIQQQ